MKPALKVAVAGLGTVGGGVLKLLAANGARIAERCGRSIEIVAVSARDRSLDRGVDLSGLRWYGDPVAMAAEADADVLVELIGGADGPARAACERAIAAGRHVVTANKAMLAIHGTALARAAEARGVGLAFEAAVAGGIPVIKALSEGLAANRIARVYGILNGTSNYILTQMRRTGQSFDTALAEAQRLGYAETDPSFDVDGVDAAHKLAVLAAVAFGAEVDFASVHIEGIRRVAAEDMRYAEDLGYRIKLLCVARTTELGLEQRVHPAMVRIGTPIAHVEDVFNAVVVEGDFVGKTVYEGRGAGEGPTASAVVADLIDIARGAIRPAFAAPAASLRRFPAAPMERRRGAYYVRLRVVDRPGVIADVAGALRDQNVSLESMIQRGRAPDERVPVVLTTHETEEGAMGRALDRIARLGTVVEPPCAIRIEEF